MRNRTKLTWYFRAGIKNQVHRRFVATQVDRFQKEQVVEVIAPWLVNPETSKFYKIWNIVVTLMLQVELICVPLVLVRPESLLRFEPLFKTLDFLWLVNIMIQM